MQSSHIAGIAFLCAAPAYLVAVGMLIVGNFPAATACAIVAYVGTYIAAEV